MSDVQITGLQSDRKAIGELQRAFAAQCATFDCDRDPSLDVRRGRLEALIAMMASSRGRIAEALAADFGCHPKGASDLIEVLGVIGRATHVLEHLDEWMRPSPREVNSTFFGSATAEVRLQPKGVVGNIVPWNFPFDLSVGPMVDMLAAGNRVILKPSEYTPACAALLQEMVSATFDPDLVHVAVGGVDLARAFASVPWDHLLYTGSPDIGRKVMTAAADNLTPVTLELGGKCPAVLTPGSVTPANVESIMGTKVVKSGQMCVSVDYCLVPRGDLEMFADLARRYAQRATPGYSASADCTGIISTRHLDRLELMLEEAFDAGARVVVLEPENQTQHERRRMPISLVLDPSHDLQLMREEIFGPILPLVPYDDLEQAIAMINAGERPLGLYVFGDNSAFVDLVVAQTSSGGVAINTCAVQSALPSMGFGGSGMSGFGRHHGIEGFREFSNARGVVTRGQGDNIDAFYAPYTKAEAIVDAALGAG